MEVDTDKGVLAQQHNVVVDPGSHAGFDTVDHASESPSPEGRRGAMDEPEDGGDRRMAWGPAFPSSLAFE